MNYIVGDIGNTSTRICLLNKKFTIIKSYIFDTKKIFEKKYFKNIINVSRTKIAIKNSLTLYLTLLMHEIIHIGVIKVVKTINKIEIPSTPNLNFIKLLIQDFSSTND